MTATDSAKSRWWHDPATFRALRAVAAAIPVVGVNTAAFFAQFAFWHAHVPWPVAGQLLIALSLESVAIYLAWHAHLARMSNDSAGGLTLNAYVFALGMGVMNYSHYADHWRPTVFAVTAGCLSAISPRLWGVHSKRASRDKLLAQGLIEPHAVRLGANRWMWHMIRSVRVTFWATWHGVNDPKRAIAHFANRYGTADTPEPARRARKHVPAAAPSGVPGTEPVPAGPAALAPEPPDVPAPVPPVLPEPAPAPEAAPADVPAGPVPAERAIENPDAREALASGTGHLVGFNGESQAVMIDGTRVNEVSPGTRVNGSPVTAEAHLEADATVSGGRPPQKVIDEVELNLAAMPLDDLPSIRAIARMLGDENQRRLAARLRKARIAAGTGLAQAPESESAHPGNGARPGRPEAPVMIASPERFQPGGSVNG